MAESTGSWFQSQRRAEAEIFRTTCNQDTESVVGLSYVEFKFYKKCYNSNSQMARWQ